MTKCPLTPQTNVRSSPRAITRQRACPNNRYCKAWQGVSSISGCEAISPFASSTEQLQHPPLDTIITLFWGPENQLEIQLCGLRDRANLTKFHKAAGCMPERRVQNGQWVDTGQEPRSRSPGRNSKYPLKCVKIGAEFKGYGQATG